jgi:hypothetical protein
MSDRRIYLLLVSALLGLLLFAPAAGAEDPNSATHEARSPKRHQASETTVEAAPPHTDTPVLQTRQTVKRRIESIEPATWLQRFGQVRVVARSSRR